MPAKEKHYRHWWKYSSKSQDAAFKNTYRGHGLQKRAKTKDGELFLLVLFQCDFKAFD